jgi:hypothetical protein
LLTKYGLAFHIACICLFPVCHLSQSSVDSQTPLLWLSLVALEWMFLLPAVRRGETWGDARERVLHALWWDPFFYIGVVVVALVGVQCLNSGCELVYLPDIDVWQLSKPAVTWAPFSVEWRAAYTQLAVFAGCATVGLGLRDAVGKASKRVLLQGLACVSGCISCVWVVLACLGREPYVSLTSGLEPSAAGTFFGLWLLLGMGLSAEARARGQRGRVLLFLAGTLGNLFGMLFFANPLILPAFIVAVILFSVYWLAYLSVFVSKVVQLKLFLCAVACGGAIIGSLWFVYPQNPVAAKLKAVVPVAEYWDSVSGWKSVRAKAAMTVWQDHPWTGVGAGGFSHYVGLAVKPDAWRTVEKNRGYVYNDGVQFLCEYGAFGAGLLLAALISLLIPLCYRSRLLWKPHPHGETGGRVFLFRLSPVAVAGCLAAVFCGVESLFASPFRSPALLLAWMCVMASMPAFLQEQTGANR